MEILLVTGSRVEIEIVLSSINFGYSAINWTYVCKKVLRGIFICW